MINANHALWRSEVLRNVAKYSENQAVLIKFGRQSFTMVDLKNDHAEPTKVERKKKTE